MDSQEYVNGRSPSNIMPTAGEEEIVADVDEPPDYRPFHQGHSDFHKSAIRPPKDRKESLLTQALHTVPANQTFNPDIHVAVDMSRRRSTRSNASAASTADLTSDEGITSPARTNTPSPPFPTSTYMYLAPYVIGRKPNEALAPPMVQQDPGESVINQLPATDALSKPGPAVEALVKKRCITFACGGQNAQAHTQIAPKTVPSRPAPAETKGEKDAPKRSIKFACPGPNQSEKTRQVKESQATPVVKTTPPSKELIHRHNNRSPSLTRKYRSTAHSHTKPHRDSTSTVRRLSGSPVTVRSRKPTYIAADEETMRSSEARFHEFASDEVQEDDWIREDVSETKQKLTINDTLRKENAIRQLGREVEEEALQDEEDDENEDDIEDEDYMGADDDEDEDQDEETIDGSDIDASDGNETDNEAGFADSDDESDAAGDFQFWTPGQSILGAKHGDTNTFRGAARLTASESSIDSVKDMSPIAQATAAGKVRRVKASRRIKIRPGTPDLPDSTDFVCGTLDEDRPLEDAYVSCMEARKREKHRVIPQDIDPSFPTSDPEVEDEDNVIDAANDSDEHIWLHGKFEDSDDELARRRRRSTHKSPALSPNRLHSPPPPRRHHSPTVPKQRLRSPPPRRLFGGHSPARLRSPPPARTIRSPAASPTTHAVRGPISFAPLGQRPGLTHTKSLPRTPNVFDQQYRTCVLNAVSGGGDSSDTAGGHTRGAIDIVKGLEHKRQRRKEKLYQKHCNRARKGQAPRRPQPGRGAERMKEVGLQLAGKMDERTGKPEYVISL